MDRYDEGNIHYQLIIFQRLISYLNRYVNRNWILPSIHRDSNYVFLFLTVRIGSIFLLQWTSIRIPKDIDYCILAYYRKIVLLLYINRSNYLCHKFICNVLKIRLYSYFRAKVSTSHAMAQCRFQICRSMWINIVDICHKN